MRGAANFSIREREELLLTQRDQSSDRDEFARLATQAGVRSQKDKLEEFVQLRPNDKRRTDLKLFSQGNSGGDLFVDFTVGHPTADSYMPSASMTPGYTITRLNKTKNDKYLAACNEVGVDFLPCAFETFGHASTEATSILQQLVRRAIETDCRTSHYSVLMSYWKRHFHSEREF